VIQNYVRSQGGAYQKWHHQQGSLFEEQSE
jgi:hypothetical protein